MINDIFLYMLIVLAFVGFLLLLTFAKDSRIEGERDAQQHPHVLAAPNSMMGYGILAGIYLVLLLCAHFLRKRLV